MLLEVCFNICLEIYFRFPTPRRCGSNVESCSTDAEAAYTEDYTPELGSVVADQYEVIWLIMFNDFGPCGVAHHDESISV